MSDDPKPPPDVFGGHFYVRSASGTLRKVTHVAGEADVSVWICRRVVDYPEHTVPAGGRVDACSRCGAPIVYNPARVVTAPRVCMQCAGIEPYPIETGGAS